AGLQSTLKFSPAERDELYLKLTELDPLRRHASPGLDQVSDLPRLWRALEASHRVVAELPPTSGPIWELKASAAQAGKKTDDYAAWRERDSTFGYIIGRHDFVRALQSYLASLTAEPMKLEN
ncbi:MAG: hypothetical protein ABUL61_00530, partial [Oleiharenicola lentus]